VLKLTASDLHDRKLTLREPKSGREHEVVFIPQKLTDRLREYAAACDPATLGIRFVIELDDSTHGQPRRKAMDQFVDNALQAAGITVVHVPAKKGYSVHDIQNTLSQAGY